MSTTPPQQPETPSEQPSQQPSQRRRDPRRDLAGAGFLLLGGWFATTSWGIDSSVVLRLLLVLLGVAVAGYGLAQLVQNRRR
ncbi:hypothetical protein [Quadrisphaera sp. KR29]|uniref:hypothetical protein n=1 Tax=Quadrisphaera sp. KR29 TaxID=3461391 RepID=UPI00404466E2